MPTEFSPREALERLLRGWPWLMALALLGGLLGWSLARLRPPVYETSAVVRVWLDAEQYAREQQTRNLTVILRENTLGWVEAVWSSPQLLNALPGADDLLEAQIQRFEGRWLLTVRAHDPQRAAALADAWAAQALSLGETYLEAAHQARDLRRQAFVWQACLEQETEIAAFNACAETDFAALGEVPPALNELEAEIAALDEQARHFSAALTFEQVAPAPIPTRPVLYSTAWLTLAGALLGGLAALFWLLLRRP